MLSIIAESGKVEDYPLADLTNDGAINVADLTKLLSIIAAQ
jgi:hypothetical protein